MASFFHKKLEDISIAQKIGELRLEHEPGSKYDFDVKGSRGLCWHVVFSPDESYFAWISSPKQVVLVPWNRELNQLASTASSYPFLHNKENITNTNNKPVTSQASSGSSTAKCQQQRPLITIECCYPVLSLAFGSGIPVKKLLYQELHKNDDIHRKEKGNDTENNNGKHYWRLFNFNEDVILATGHTNGRICIWCVKTGKLLLELMDHKTAVRDLSFAPDGSLRLISASVDKTLKGWDLKDDGNMYQTFSYHKNAVLWCCWSPNAQLMASTSSDKTICVWNMNTKKVFQVLVGHAHEVVSCSFSPDSAVLATASWDSQVFLWDPYLGKILYKIYHLHPPPKMIYASGANNAWVRSVSYSRNGMNLVTISDDHLIRFWNLMGDVDPQGIALEDEQTLSCAYSPTGRCVAVGTAQFKTTFYATPVEIPKLIHFARMAVRNQLETQDVDGLELPKFLKQYLKYEIWDK